MGHSITLEIHGLKETAIAVGRWGADVEAAAQRELGLQISRTVIEMQQRARIGRTGRLQRDIKGRVDPVGVTGMIRAAAPHARPVERGHRIVTHAGRDTGKRVRGVSPSFFIVPIQDGRQRFYDRLKAILQRPIPVLDVTPTVVER